MARLEEIAKATGYSTCTVSKVLRNRGNCSQTVRQTILNKAGQLGYQANAAASLLARQRHRSKQAKNQLRIGLVSNHRESFLSLNGFHRACSDYGYEGEYIDLHDFQSPRNMVHVLWNRGFSGLMLRSYGNRWSEDEWLEADWSHLAVVKHNRGFPRLDFPLVRHSAFDYMLFTLRQVAARGYRRIGVLMVDSISDVDNVARKGAMFAFAEEFNNSGGVLQFREVNMPEFRLEMDGHYLPEPEICEWLKNFKPDAVVSFPYTWIYSLKSAGFRIPEDFGFATIFTSFYYSGETHVCGADPQYDTFEYRMVELLHNQLQIGARGLSGRSGVLQNVVLPTWIECGTLPDRSSAPAQLLCYAS